MARPKKVQEEFAIPSSPVDRKAIRDSVREIENLVIQADSIKAAIKDAQDSIKEKVGIPKDLIMKLVKAHLDGKYDEMVAKNEEFADTYEIVMGITPTMEEDDASNDE